MAQASKEALCWQCRRATGGCEWSAFLQPVPGWQAERTFRRVRRGGAVQLAPGIRVAATLGPEVDALIRQRQAQSMAEAVLCDAAATALIECVCDEAEKTLAAGLARGERLTRRYSCGYGDLPLSLQPDFVRVLDTPRKIGLACTPSLLLTPQKSVTAVLGIAKAPPQPRQARCETCAFAASCQMRKAGTHCGR